MATQKTEQQLWEENKNELAALIKNLNEELLNGEVLNPHIGFVQNWSRGSGAYSMRLSKKRQIKEKRQKKDTPQKVLEEAD